MEIRTFTGFTSHVDQCVNDFIRNVEVIGIQTHATGNGTMAATVIYEEDAGDGRE